jgi:hypothetical protein
MPDQLPEHHSETLNLPMHAQADLACLVQGELSDSMALLSGTSRVTETIAELNSERTAQMNEIVAARERHNEILAGIDAQLRRSRREPTDRHQLTVGLGVWAALSFAAAFAFHALGADLAQIEIDLVIADFTLVIALIFWVAGTAAIGVLKESAASSLAEKAREAQTQQLAADIAAAEGAIRGIDATLDRIRARAPFISKKEPAAGAMRINPIDGAEMVYIPAGPSIMGMQSHEIEEIPSSLAADEIVRQFHRGCVTDNGPRREVHLDG